MKTPLMLVGKNRNRIKVFPQEEENPFFREWLAAGQPPEQLSISSVCNARCLFCSNRMNPFPIRQNMFREVEDIKLQLSLGNANYDGAIHMSDSLPGRISEGEAFIHPRFFEILALIREKFLTNRLHFTTNGSLLAEPFVRQLAPFRPIEINVSLHSTHPKLWAGIFRRPEKMARIAMDSFGLFKKYHIDFTGTIVPLPRVCGWDDIERTFSFLVAEGAKSVVLWWPGFSEKTPDSIKKAVECPWEEFEDFVERVRIRFPGFPITPQPNLMDPRMLPLRRIMNSTLHGNLKTYGGAFHHVLWLVSEAAYPEISRLVEQFARDVPNKHLVVRVQNSSYGGNIRVSGLLMVSDLLAAGKEALEKWPETDLVLIPKTPFDAFFRDLQKTPAYRIPESLDRPTWLIYENGLFHPLKARGFVKPEDDTNTLLKKTVKRFDQFIREDQWDSILSLVASLPVQTSAGILKKRALLDFLRQAKSRFPQGGDIDKRTLEKLDDGRVLYLEEWPTLDPSNPLTRWFMFRKMGGDWKIEAIFLSSPHNSFDKNS